MNKDQVTGKAEQLKGRIKEGLGEAFDSQNLANEGVVDQVKGTARETWGNAKDAVQTTVDGNRREAEYQAGETRAGIRGNVHGAADTINDRIDAYSLREKEKQNTA